MGDQQQPHTIHHANRLPAQLAILDPVDIRNMAGIREHTDGIFKSVTMFAQVRRSLGRTPSARPDLKMSK
jgi:hypothetical protein